MKKGFTLIELLVVMGIMAMLTAMAIGSYRALTRGMEDRGAVVAAQGFMDTVVQRADVDRTAVEVFFYNRLDQKESSDGTRDRRGHGMAVAVRPCGRVTGKATSNGGTLVLDEFGDLDQMYMTEADLASREKSGSGRKPGMRLYIMDGSGKYFDVEPTICEWSSTEPCIASAQDGQDDSAGGGAAREITVHAYRMVGGTEPSVGDPYGMEFQNVELPNGYYFGGSAPTAVGTSAAGRMSVAPGSSGGAVDVCRQAVSSSSVEKVGTAKGRM